VNGAGTVTTITLAGGTVNLNASTTLGTGGITGTTGAVNLATGGHP